MNWKLACVFFLVVGCSHSGKKLQSDQEPLPPDFLLNKETKQITFSGESMNPRFSADGNRMLFASRGRNFHKGWQIYEYDFRNNKERRVTFSDGDAFDPLYLDGNSLVYASTTDEIKESPFKSSQVEPSDIYTSGLYGNDIQRLIQNPGYDAHPNLIVIGKSQQLVFSSFRYKLWGIYQYDFKRKTIQPLSSKQGWAKKQPHVNSTLNQMVWVEENLKTKQKSLVLYNFKTKKMETLIADFTELENPYLSEAPAPKVFFSIKRPGEEFFHLEVYDIKTKCTQVIFKAQGSLHSPVPHKQGSHIVFSRSFQNQRLLYSLPLPQDLGPCLEKASEDKINP